MKKIKKGWLVWVCVLKKKTMPTAAAALVFFNHSDALELAHVPWPRRRWQTSSVVHGALKRIAMGGSGSGFCLDVAPPGWARAK